MVGAAGAGARRWLGRATGVMVLVMVGCGGGGGKDRSFKLPAGNEVGSIASSRVLLVVEAGNECEQQGDCVPTPVATPSPGGAANCDLGHGNTRGLAFYRLATNNLLLDDPLRPGAPDDPEQVIATADNPRRLLIHPNKPDILYLATFERIQVFRIASIANGGTRCIGQTRSEQELDPGADELDPIDLAIDPTIADGVLYVAASGPSRIDAYAINPDGSLPEVPTSCVIGGGSERFAALAPLSAGFIAAGGHDRIEIFQRAEGQFPPPVPASMATPTPEPSPEQRCRGVQLTTEPVSAIGGALVTDVFFVPSDTAPLGQLFVSEEVSQRVFTFPIDTTGVLDDDDTSRTASAGVYQRLLRHGIGTNAILYASVFNEGRVDVFRLESGLLPQNSFSRTAEDPDALPVAMAIDGAAGTVLYVTQGGLGRVDGFQIQSDGGLDALPLTSTRPVLGVRGQILDTFPDDLAIVDLP